VRQEKVRRDKKVRRENCDLRHLVLVLRVEKDLGHPLVPRPVEGSVSKRQFHALEQSWDRFDSIYLHSLCLFYRQNFIKFKY
jgi:hypothetical protein